MKNQLMITGFIVLLAIGGYASANEGPGSGAGSMTDHNVKTAQTIVVGNKICPVSGNRVDDGKMGEAVKFEHNGKIYNLCCSMCIKDFKKDPEKYSKIADEEVAKEKTK